MAVNIFGKSTSKGSPVNTFALTAQIGKDYLKLDGASVVKSEIFGFTT